jgi:glutathione peroxidase
MRRSVFYSINLIFLMLSFSAKAEGFYLNKYIDTNKRLVDFSEFKGKVVLIVNIATRCGYTGQLEDIEKLYQKFKTRDFKIVGFPSNDFGDQTPESSEEVGKFCRLKYGATFPIIEKQNLIGNKKTSLYKWLNSQKGYEHDVEWNFEKFIIGKEGKIIGRFPSRVEPLDKNLITLIEKNLK